MDRTSFPCTVERKFEIIGEALSHEELPVLVSELVEITHASDEEE